MLRVALILLLGLTGCSAGDVGAACSRHTDCQTGYCSAIGACAIPLDAGTAPDDAVDASTTIPPGEDAAPDGAIDAPDDL
ncbi:MAG: hypothetical protein ABI867_12865 [Kofleriaceae bacterium]